MNDQPTTDSPQTLPNEFKQASQQSNPSWIWELLGFIGENKKWWMIPIFVVLGLVGLLVALASSGAAPFIYTVF